MRKSEEEAGAQKGAQSRIAELDGLRACAVTAVVLAHMIGRAKSLPAPASPFAQRFLESLGQHGVSIFFVISGFIITTLLLREREKTGRVHLTAFYVRRCFRILPPFASYLATIAILNAYGVISVSAKALFLAALFWVNPNDPQSWFVGHVWSLAVEEQYYLVFPPLFCLVLRFRRRRTLLVLAGLYGLCLIAPTLAHTHPALLNMAVLYNFRHIIVGVALALLGRPAYAFLSQKTAFTLLLPWGLGLFVLFSERIHFPSPVNSLPVSALEPVACGLFVMWFAENPLRSGLLRLPVLQWVGLCSYSIYLWQQLFTGAAVYYHGWSLAQSPWSVLAILACAATSYYGIERPCMGLGRRISKKLVGSSIAVPLRSL